MFLLSIQDRSDRDRIARMLQGFAVLIRSTHSKHSKHLEGHLPFPAFLVWIFRSRRSNEKATTPSFPLSFPTLQRVRSSGTIQSCQMVWFPTPRCSNFTRQGDDVSHKNPPR